MCGAHRVAPRSIAALLIVPYAFAQSRLQNAKNGRNFMRPWCTMSISSGPAGWPPYCDQWSPSALQSGLGAGSLRITSCTTPLANLKMHSINEILRGLPLSFLTGLNTCSRNKVATLGGEVPVAQDRAQSRKHPAPPRAEPMAQMTSLHVADPPD